MADVVDYGRDKWAVSVNGQNLVGISAAADAITFPSTEVGMVSYSADGLMISSSTGKRGGPVPVKVTPGTPADRFLGGLLSKIKSGMLITMTITARHKVTGETVSCEKGIMMHGTSATAIGGGIPADNQYNFEFESVVRTT